MLVKAIFSDLDGTLKSEVSKDVVPNTVKRKIKKIQKKGVIFGIVTGKSLKRMKDYPVFNIINGPAILEGGCVILEKNEFGIFEKNKKWDSYIKKDFRILKKAAESYSNRNVIWKSRTFTIKDGPEPKIPERYKNVIDFRRNREYYDFYPKKAGKLNAIKYVCKKKNIDFSNLIYIGDNINDIDILKKAGLPCTVKNAPEEIKKVVREKNGIITRNESYWGVSQIFLNILENG